MAGVQAPEISLKSMDGQPFSLKEALKKGPVIAAFYKVSCPVCQMALPYVDRLFQAYDKSGKLTIVGVSQDGVADTKAFNREFGVSFPVLLDEKGYPVSSAYQLTNVPTTFLISTGGEIETAIVSWSRAEMEELNQKLAAISGLAPAQLFRSSDRVPDFRPG
ncbi:MAG TPA: TlpA disulfide reductase family protein [Candidatus Limnocylindrales bacterium]|nr:TlpA disulfide reductase family protein [Candidatus Limnocylindrales bacterium]